MTSGTGETGLTCAFELHIVFLGDFENVLTVFGSDLFASAIPLDESESDLGGEGELRVADEGEKDRERFEHGDYCKIVWVNIK